MIKSIIFDIGGVLAYDVWEYLLLDEQHGVAAKYDLDREQVLKAAKEMWLKFEHRNARNDEECNLFEREYWDLFLERFRITTTIDELIDYTGLFIRPVEGMSNLLAELKAKGLILLICSNNNEFWFRRQAAKCSFHRFFDPNKIILSNRVGASKWSANFEMFYAVVKAAGVSKEECLLVDDRAENMERASQFGMPAILFPQNSNGYGANYLRALFREIGVL